MHFTFLMFCTDQKKQDDLSLPSFNHSAQEEYLHTFRTLVAVIGTTEQGQHSVKLYLLGSRTQRLSSSFTGNSISRQELTVNAHQNRGLE